MTYDEIAKLSVKINKAVDNISKWDITDQLLYMNALCEYLRKAEQIVDKYDPGKPKKFIIKRLDEI